MNRDRRNRGRPSGRLAAALAGCAFALAVSGAALACTPTMPCKGSNESHPHDNKGSGGGCSTCGGGGGNDAAVQDAGQRAKDKADAAVNQGESGIFVGSGGRPSEAMGGAIAQLGATQPAAEEAERERKRREALENLFLLGIATDKAAGGSGDLGPFAPSLDEILDPQADGPGDGKAPSTSSPPSPTTTRTPPSGLTPSPGAADQPPSWGPRWIITDPSSPPSPGRVEPEATANPQPAPSTAPSPDPTTAEPEPKAPAASPSPAPQPQPDDIDEMMGNAWNKQK